jgi:aryl carrier-like protein
MRAEQMTALYDSTFTKKDAIKTGENLIQSVLDSGDIEIMELGANLVRLEQVVSAAVSKFRNHIIDNEKQLVLGVEFNPVNGGNTVNYHEDLIYCDLKKDLDARVELLKLAQKQDVFDAYGEQVPKVNTKARKSSVTIKF